MPGGPEPALSEAERVRDSSFVILSETFRFALRIETCSRKIAFLPEPRGSTFGYSYGLLKRMPFSFRACE